MHEHMFGYLLGSWQPASIYRQPLESKSKSRPHLILQEISTERAEVASLEKVWTEQDTNRAKLASTDSIHANLACSCIQARPSANNYEYFKASIFFCLSSKTFALAGDTVN
jgi:hypothetical protein